MDAPSAGPVLPPAHSATSTVDLSSVETSFSVPGRMGRMEGEAAKMNDAHAMESVKYAYLMAVEHCGSKPKLFVGPGHEQENKQIAEQWLKEAIIPYMKQKYGWDAEARGERLFVVSKEDPTQITQVDVIGAMKVGGDAAGGGARWGVEDRLGVDATGRITSSTGAFDQLGLTDFSFLFPMFSTIGVMANGIGRQRDALTEEESSETQRAALEEGVALRETDAGFAARPTAA